MSTNKYMYATQDDLNALVALIRNSHILLLG